MSRHTDRESLRRTLWRLVVIVPIIGLLTHGAFAYRVVTDDGEFSVASLILVGVAVVAVRQMTASDTKPLVSSQRE